MAAWEAILDPLSDLSVAELVLRLRTLQYENDKLRRVLVTAMCGNAMNHETTCQLPRDHEGLHAWAAPDSDLVVRWA